MKVGKPAAILESWNSEAVPTLTGNELASHRERLIDRLDMLDGDPDADEDDAENAFASAL